MNADRARFEAAVTVAFLGSFRTMMFAAAGLAMLSALIAALMMGRRPVAVASRRLSAVATADLPRVDNDNLIAPERPLADQDESSTEGGVATGCVPTLRDLSPAGRTP
jgi:hypothetical protein